MKKIALSIIGGLLFVAGYYHVHRQSAYVATKNAQAGSEIPPTPVSASPLKSLPVLHSDQTDLSSIVHFKDN